MDGRGERGGQQEERRDGRERGGGRRREDKRRADNRRVGGRGKGGDQLKGEARRGRNMLLGSMRASRRHTMLIPIYCFVHKFKSWWSHGVLYAGNTQMFSIWLQFDLHHSKQHCNTTWDILFACKFA